MTGDEQKNDFLRKTFLNKVAVIVPKYGLVGGAEAFVAELTSRLARRRPWEYHVFANKWFEDGGIRFHKVPILSFPRFLITTSFAWLAQRRIRREAGIKPFDLIHTHDRLFHADLFTMHSIPHRLWVSEIRKKRMSLFDRATAWVERKLVETGTCRFAAVSELTREKFLQVYPGVPNDRVSVIHPGIDCQAYTSLSRVACRSEIRTQHGIDENDFVLLFVSMNFDIKGLDFVFQGLSRLRALMPDKRWNLLIAGKDDYPRYNRMAKALGIRDRIIFAGVIQRDLLKRYYLASDAFIMPSRFDTFGLTVLEAMAAGLPAIVSRNVGAKDVITQGENGFVIQHTDRPEDIAAAVNAVMDRDAHARMAEAAQKTASLYSWDATAEKTQALYDIILAEKATGRR